MINYNMGKTITSKPKIISDEAVTILLPKNIEKKENVALISGGGLNQTFFSMGSFKCLVDNNRFYDKKTKKFYFHVIAAISGGTLLAVFLDLATNTQFSYHLQDNWYEKYIRAPIYTLSKANLLKFSVNNQFNISKLSKYVFELIPEYNKPLTVENTNIRFEYYYIDVNTNSIISDHSDIINFKDGVNVSKVPYWYFIRLARCCLPLTNFYNRPTYDGGSICNNPTPVLTEKYSASQCIIIASNLKLIYDSYPKLPVTTQILGALGTIINSANSTINSALDYSSTNICSSMSNSLSKSNDTEHKGLFTDWEKQIPKNIRYYNGVLFCYSDILKVVENEGYIQMFRALKKQYPNDNLVFDIPNPDVYNKQKAKKIIKKTSNLVFVPEIIKSLF